MSLTARIYDTGEPNSVWRTRGGKSIGKTKNFVLKSSTFRKLAPSKSGPAIITRYLYERKRGHRLFGGLLETVMKTGVQVLRRAVKEASKPG